MFMHTFTMKIIVIIWLCHFYVKIRHFEKLNSTPKCAHEVYFTNVNGPMQNYTTLGDKHCVTLSKEVNIWTPCPRSWCSFYPLSSHPIHFGHFTITPNLIRLEPTVCQSRKVQFSWEDLWNIIYMHAQIVKYDWLCNGFR